MENALRLIQAEEWRRKFSWIELTPFPLCIIEPPVRVIICNSPCTTLFEEVVDRSRVLEILFGLLEFRDDRAIEIEVGERPNRVLQAFVRWQASSEEHEQGLAYVTLLDITHLRAMESVRRDFVSNLTHELKTPMTLIRGAVETLREDSGITSARSRSFFDVIARHVNRMNGLVDDLSTLSQLESTRSRNAGLVCSETSIRDLLLEAVQVATEANVSDHLHPIEVNCSPQITWRVARRLMVQGITNLIQNACLHSQDGQKIFVRARTTGKGLRIEVQDYGCGIALEHHDRVFERFYRVDPSRSRSLGGSGLGLAIVKHIAQAHGGTVGLQSAPNEGSLFFIEM